MKEQLALALRPSARNVYSGLHSAPQRDDMRWRRRLPRRSGVRMRDEEEIKGKLVVTVYLKEILQ